jgi:DNA-binding transcriptional regulator YiaG
MKNTIKKLRNSTGLTQAEFAKALDVHISSVKFWETGRSTPHVLTVEGIKARVEKLKRSER